MLVGNRLDYRLFPIFILTFLRVSVANASEFAILLYYSSISINPELIAIIISMRSFAYLFSPFLFNKFSQKIGYKKSLIISSSGFLFIYLFLQIFLSPFWSLILFFIDGILAGLFWPVLISSLSAISTLPRIRHDDSLKNKIFKNYGLSQNIGSILTFLLGSVFSFITSNTFFILNACFFLSIICIFIVITFQEPKKSAMFNSQHQQQFKTSQEARITMKIPLYIPLFLIIIYTFAMGALGFLYPLKSNALHFAMYTAYFISFLRISVQTLSFSILMSLSLKTLKKLIPFSAIVVSLSFLFMGYNTNFLVFIFLIFMFGISISIFYVFSFKLIVFLNVSRRTSKFSVYYETIYGLGFWISPVLAGFLATININFAFYIMAFLILINLSIYLVIKGKIIFIPYLISKNEMAVTA